MRAIKRIISIAAAALITAAAVFVVPAQTSAMQGDDAQAITKQISDTYKAAKKRNGGESFSGYCAKYVRHQLYVLGIDTEFVGGNGNEKYDIYRKLTTTTGGYAVTAYSGSDYSLKSALEEMTGEGAKNVYNILVGFEKSGTSAGKKYGHVFFIHAVLGGTVYYSENSSNSYGSEGSVLTCSISDLAARYSSSNGYVLDGLIHFYMAPKADRIAGANRYLTAAANLERLREVLGVEKFENMIVASGENFPDALSGSWLSVRFTAPILLVGSAVTESGLYPGLSVVKDCIGDYLAENGTVYILGGTSAVPQEAEDELAELCSVKRLFGESRFETNLEILDTAGSGDELIVCSGKGFADALSASAAGRAIMLVDSGEETLNEAQTAYFADKQFKRIYILGGTAAVSAGIEAALGEYASEGVVRISGADRYHTSTALAGMFFPDADGIAFTTGTSYPDGLTGGLLASILGVPVVLLNDVSYARSAASSYLNGQEMSHVYVFGGSSAVSDSLIDKVTR